MFETSLIELSQSALKKNIRFLKRQLPAGTTFSSVIKGNAYGHGIPCYVPMAEKCGLRHFSVFSADEALKVLQRQSRSNEIMIMGSLDNEEIPWAIQNGISFYVFDLDRARRAIKVAGKLKKKARIHLELETGLNRTGLTDKQLYKLVDLIGRHQESVQVEGVCTHFAGAESLSNYLRIQHQLERFRTSCAGLARAGMSFGADGVKRHTACSAAALIYPDSVMEMARIGIAQFGFWPSKETEINYYARKPTKRKRTYITDPLTRVIKWKSRVMSTSRVKRGDYVGYGSSSLITRPARVASVPVGYFHGFARDLSNRGHVLVRGRRAPVAGTVNMNMIMIDVTDIPGVKKGDEVVLIGKQGNNTISVGSFGELTRFVNYELLVSLPTEIPRIIVD